MKKIIMLLSVFLSILLFIGCAGNSYSENTNSNKPNYNIKNIHVIYAGFDKNNKLLVIRNLGNNNYSRSLYEIDYERYGHFFDVKGFDSNGCNKSGYNKKTKNLKGCSKITMKSIKEKLLLIDSKQSGEIQKYIIKPIKVIYERNVSKERYKDLNKFYEVLGQPWGVL